MITKYLQKKQYAIIFATSLFMIFAFFSLALSEDRLVIKNETTETFKVSDQGKISAGEYMTDAKSTRTINSIGEQGGMRLWRVNNAFGPFLELIFSKQDSPDSIISFWDIFSGTQYGPNMLAIRDRTSGADKIQLSITSSGMVGLGLGNTPANFPLELSNGAYCSVGGTWVNGSSRDYKENIEELTIHDALEALNDLDPVIFNYKVEPNEKLVGFIAEDVPQLVATNTRKGLSAMDIVAVLTKIVKEQQQTIDELSNKVNKIARLNK